jgi:predicted O-methyltransferase YrrM
VTEIGKARSPPRIERGRLCDADAAQAARLKVTALGADNPRCMNRPGSPFARLLDHVIDECSSVAYRTLIRHAPDLLLKRLGVATPGRRPDFYTLARIVRTMDEFSGAILECGTHHGATLLGMAHILRSREIPARLYGLDSFEGFPEPTVEDAQDDGTMHPWVRKGALGEASFEQLKARLASMDLTAQVTLIKGFFNDTLPRLKAERFSLVHLDCDLYQSYISCLEFVYPRMLPGGIIVFDDYGSPPYAGARRAVDEFFTDRPERLQFYPEAPGPRYFMAMGGGIAPGASAVTERRIPEERRAA